MGSSSDAGSERRLGMLDCSALGGARLYSQAGEILDADESVCQPILEIVLGPLGLRGIQVLEV